MGGITGTTLGVYEYVHERCRRFVFRVFAQQPWAKQQRTRAQVKSHSPRKIRSSILISLTSSIANYSGTWQKVASLGMCWKHGQSCTHWYDAILLTFSARIATIHLRCSTSCHFKSVQFYRLHFINHIRSFVIPRDSFKPDFTGRYATLVALGSFLCATKAYSNTFLLKFVTTASWLRVYFHSSYFDTNFVVVNCFCGNFGAVSSWSDDHCEGLLACHTMCSIL